jgi:hypothetical protein
MNRVREFKDVREIRDNKLGNEIARRALMSVDDEMYTPNTVLSAGHKHNNLLMSYGQSDIIGIHSSTDVFSLREISGAVSSKVNTNTKRVEQTVKYSINLINL